MKQKNKRLTLFSIIVIIIVMIAVAVATFVNAAYIKNTGEVNNIFKPADSVIPGIEEEFNKTVKEDVYFEVNEKEYPETEYPVYMRVKIVITWQDKDGIVYYKPVENDDYYIDLNLTDWTLKDDGFYYYKSAVESGDKTTNLINVCKQMKAAPAEDYTLSVEVIVQTIQAIGYTDGENGATIVDAWEDAAWKVS